MLECHFGTNNLSLISSALQLPAEFRTLGEARGSEGVTFGDQATAGVDNYFAAIGKVSAVDGMTSVARGTKIQGLVSTQFVC